MLRRNLLSRSGAFGFAQVPMGPPDPILGLGVAFNADKNPKKVNLGVGVYRGDDGKPFVLECVKKAQAQILNVDHEYAPITGVPAFVTAAQKLAFSPSSSVLAAGRLASSQTLSGTGALRVSADFLNRWYKGSKTIYIPDKTWPNHVNVFKDAGLDVQRYNYYDPTSKGVALAKTLDDLSKLPKGSMVLLHACAHNPTGVDFDQAAWNQVKDVLVRNELFPFIDMAYQGFASGDADRDAYGLRLISQAVPNLVVAQSFAKSFGLYGQRVGAMHIQTESSEVADKVTSQLKILIRPMYSNPPLHGARIVAQILGNADLTAEWHKELKLMADRMNGVRSKLVEGLAKEGSKLDWSHITRQIGMMAYTGLSTPQVAQLKTDFSIYMTDDGRAAITGLNSTNVDYVAKAFHAVTSK